MIRFQCPNCNTILQIGKEYAGQAVMCSACNTQLIVPQTPVPEPTLDKADTNTIICICGQCKSTYKLPVASAGRQVPCPKCGQSWQIPEEEQVVTDSNTLKFTCPVCRQSYCVLAKYAGKKFKCLICKQPCTIPQPVSPPQDLLLVEDEQTPPPPPLEEETPAPDQGFSFKLRMEEETVEHPGHEPEPLRLQPSPPEPSPAPLPPKPPEKMKKTAEKAPRSPLKLIAGIAAGLVGFIAGFAIVYTLIKPRSPDTETVAPPAQESTAVSVTQAPEAIEFAQSIVNRLNQKTKDLKELKYQFPDDLYITDGMIQSLIKAMDIGTLTNIHSVVDQARIEFGASDYLVTTSVVSETGQRRHIRIGFFKILEINEQTYIYWIFGITISDADGTILASAGQQDTDVLITQMDELVDEHGMGASQEQWGQDTEDLELWAETYSCPILIGLFIGAIITIFSMGAVFVKAGEPGWAVIVPIYNLVVLARVGGKPEWMGLVCALCPLIPFIGGLIELYLLVNITIGVAETFGKGIGFALGLFFLPFIFYPILAATGSTFTD